MTEIVESKLTTVRTRCGARDGFDSSFFSVIHRTVGSIKYSSRV